MTEPHPQQLTFDFVSDAPTIPVFPATRYQGSKRKLAGWVWDSVKRLEFDTALDAFGGTGAIAYRFKQEGKQVTYNDNLAFNQQIGLALIENRRVTLGDDEIDLLLQPDPTCKYRGIIAETFAGIYFTDDENRWLDVVTQNIRRVMRDPYKKALAYFALYQACLVKRRYNLFHRKNLYIREAEVKRTFGNKTTWDTPFEDHFRKFIAEANGAVFDNGRENTALCQDVMLLTYEYDLVYIDPPYMSRQGVSVDYHHFYHFLEGLTRYDDWQSLIDFESKHRRLTPQPSAWCDKSQIKGAFSALLDRYAESVLVVSYRSDGIPSREELVKMLGKHKRTVVQAALPQQYALSKNTDSRELLLIGV